MRDRPSLRWSPSPDRHLDGVDHELGTEVIGDRPAHHPPAPGIEDDGQIDLALASRVLGHVHDPQPVRLGRVEVALHQVFGRRGLRITPGAASVVATVDALDAGLGHEPGHPLARAALALAQDQLGVDPRGPIGTPGHLMDVEHGVGEHRVVPVPFGYRIGPPGIEPRRRHLHDPTTRRHRQVRAALGDEGVGHFGRTFSRAK